MGGAASVNRSDITALGGSDFDFPKHGVRLSFYQEFIHQNGGKSAFEGLTTTQVCDILIKPSTVNLQCSYCDMLRSINSDAVGIATVFISHAWAYKFLDVCEALMFHFKDNIDTIVWFDLFSVNQHTTTLKPFEWWTTTFQSAIKDFGHTVMVFAPWHDPVPLRRAWCLWELYSTIQMECRFEVALNRIEQEKFFEDMSKDVKGKMDTMLATVDVAKSECWNPLDKERIFEVVGSSCGFPKLNSIVFERIREWTIAITKQEIATTSDHDTNLKYKLMMQATLGRLLIEQANYFKAKDLFDEIFQPFQEVFGPSSPETIELYYTIGCLHLSLRLFARGNELLSQAEEKQFELTGNAQDPFILLIHHRQGLSLDWQERKEEAFVSYEKTFEEMKQCFGTKDPRTLAIMSDYISVIDSSGDKERAEGMYKECYELHKDVYGQSHRSSINILYNLGTLYFEDGNTPKSIDMLKACYEQRRVILGEHHSDSLQVLISLFQIYDYEEDYENAEYYYAKRIRLIREHYGSYHEFAVRHVQGLIEWYIEKGMYDKGKALSLEFWRHFARTNSNMLDLTEYFWLRLMKCYQGEGISVSDENALKQQLLQQE